MQKIYKTLGENIRNGRRKLKLTQEKLAELANISSNFVGQIERATKKASLETVEKIANALNTSVNNLFSNADNTRKIKEEENFNSYLLTNKLMKLFKDKNFEKDLRKIILKHLK